MNNPLKTAVKFRLLYNPTKIGKLEERIKMAAEKYKESKELLFVEMALKEIINLRYIEVVRVDGPELEIEEKEEILRKFRKGFYSISDVEDEMYHFYNRLGAIAISCVYSKKEIENILRSFLDTIGKKSFSIPYRGHKIVEVENIEDKKFDKNIPDISQLGNNIIQEYEKLLKKKENYKKSIERNYRIKKGVKYKDSYDLDELYTMRSRCSSEDVLIIDYGIALSSINTKKFENMVRNGALLGKFLNFAVDHPHNYGLTAEEARIFCSIIEHKEEILEEIEVFRMLKEGYDYLSTNYNTILKVFRDVSDEKEEIIKVISENPDKAEIEEVENKIIERIRKYKAEITPRIERLSTSQKKYLIRKLEEIETREIERIVKNDIKELPIKVNSKRLVALIKNIKIVNGRVANKAAKGVIEPVNRVSSEMADGITANESIYELTDEVSGGVPIASVSSSSASGAISKVSVNKPFFSGLSSADSPANWLDKLPVKSVNELKKITEIFEVFKMGLERDRNESSEIDELCDSVRSIDLNRDEPISEYLQLKSQFGRFNTHRSQFSEETESVSGSSTNSTVSSSNSVSNSDDFDNLDGLPSLFDAIDLNKDDHVNELPVNELPANELSVNESGCELSEDCTHKSKKQIGYILMSVATFLLLAVVNYKMGGSYLLFNL